MKRILVVEDEAEMARLLQRELRLAGYEVETADSGEVGLLLHDAHPPDLLILDWMLPGLDGIEVLRRIRHTHTTPVLMLSARGEEPDRVIGLEIGADDYLAKPFGMRELLARVKALLRRTERMQETIRADRAGHTTRVACAGLSLDPELHTVHAGDREVVLSGTEFELLHLMLRNPGRAFSRGYLMETVWGVAEVPGDRSVDNAVARLRRKLGEHGSAIETVWGMGYRVRPAGG